MLFDVLCHLYEGFTSFHWLLRLSVIGTVLIVILYRYLTATHKYFQKLGVPGPEPGLFGILSDYRKRGFHEIDRELSARYGKVVGVYHARSPAYFITDPDIIKEITVKQFNKFVDRRKGDFIPPDPCFKHALTAARGQHWKFLRTSLSLVFTGARMKEVIPLIQQSCDRLNETVAKEGHGGTKDVELQSIFSRTTMDIIASIAFGLDINAFSSPDGGFFKHANAILRGKTRIIVAIFICGIFPFMANVLAKIGYRLFPKSSMEFFEHIVESSIGQRKADEKPSKDFLQLMMEVHKMDRSAVLDPTAELDGKDIQIRGLTNPEIAANSILFLFAGYDTIQLTLTFVTFLLAMNPDCQDKVLQEIGDKLKGEKPSYDAISKMTYLDNVVLESLRLYPITPRLSRHAGESVDIGGVKIEKGTDIVMGVTSVHRDPDIWADPDTFDPDRFLPENRPVNFPYAFLAFGIGPRMCIGKKLAMLEIKMVIVNLLQKFKMVASTTKEISIESKVDLLRPSHPVYIRAIPRTE